MPLLHTCLQSSHEGVDLKVYTYNAAARKAGRSDMSPVLGIKEMMDSGSRGVMRDAKGAVASSLLALLDVRQHIVGHVLGKSNTTPQGRLLSLLTAASGPREDLLPLKLC